MKSLLWQRKRAFIIYLVACFFPVLFELINVYGISLLIGSIQQGDLKYFFNMLVVCLVLTLISIGMFICSRFLRIGFMRDVLLDVRVLAFDRILSMNFEQFNQQSKEVYLSNLINDINTFEQNFFLKLLNIIFQGGKYLVSVSILLFYDWKFGLGTIIVSLLVYRLTLLFENKTVALQEDISDHNEALTVDFSNTFNGLEILKLNQVEDRFLEKTLKQIDRLENRKWFFAIFTEGQRGITRFLSNFVFVVMMVYLLQQALQGMSLTTVAFMLQLAGGCIWPIGFVIPMFNELKASLAIFNKIAKPLEGTGAPVAGMTFTFNQGIYLEDMTVQYGDRIILDQINLKFEKGKKYLIKGASGSGKTTLLRVIANMQQPTFGQIRLDETPYEALDEVAFYRQTSTIYQDVFLFEASLRDNIALFKSANEVDLDRAVNRSGLKALVDEKAQGLDLILQENGKNLSGGQRQRISIARAIYKNADLLLVDEGTSSLNDALGRDIEAMLLSLEATVIAISHRYYEGVTEGYDYVIDLKDGKAVMMPCGDYFEEAVV